MAVTVRTAAGAALVIAGAGLAIIGAASLRGTDGSAEAPYRYELAEAAATSVDENLRTALAGTGAELRKARVVSNSDGSTLAELRIAESAAGPVLLDWQTSLDEPFLTTAVPFAEVIELGKALHKHLPPDAVVLAWWDVSRQLRLLDETPVRFGQHLVGAPLALPASWRPARPAIEKVEAGFWQASATADESADAFRAWTDALLAPRDEGLRLLRARSDGRAIHLVVHIRDALLLGTMAPERIGVAFQDQADAGNLHGSINSARDWVRNEGFAAYTAYRPDDGQLRLVALIDDASVQTLVGRLLPFHDPRRSLEPIPGLTLVHQVGGFWVYRLESHLS